MSQPEGRRERLSVDRGELLRGAATCVAGGVDSGKIEGDREHGHSLQEAHPAETAAELRAFLAA